MIQDLDRQLASVFGKTVWARGRTYHRQGRVSSIEADPRGRRIHAKVQGSNGDTYLVRLRLSKSWSRDGVGPGSPGTVMCECSCPVRLNCQHGAAVMMALLEAEAPSPTRDDTELAAFGRFVSSLDSPSDTTTEVKATRVTLRYLLTPLEHDDEGVLRVTTFKVSLRKSGEIAVAQPIWLDDYVDRMSRRAPGWLSIEDVTLWFELKMYDPVDHHGAVSLGAGHPELLHRLCTTGRAHFGSFATPALQIVASVAAQPRWMLQQGVGKLRLTLDPEVAAPTSATVLPFDPPHRIEHATGHCAPLRPPAELERLRFREVPKLDPQTVSRLPPAWLDTLRRHGVPTPPARVVQARNDVRPIAVVRIGAPMRRDAAALAARATVSFEYDGVPLEPDSRFDHVFVETQTSIVQIERRRDHERGALRSLLELGAEPPESPWEDSLWVSRDVTERLLAADRSGTLPLRVELDPASPWTAIEPSQWYVEVEAAERGWFDVALGIEVDGQRIEILELLMHAFRAGASASEDLVLRLPDGRMVRVPAARVQQLAQTLVELFDDRTTPTGRLRLPRTQLGRLAGLTDVQWSGSPEGQRFAERLAAFAGFQEVAPPKGLNAELRPYQIRGLSWLQGLRALELGAVLADDMGLGKTVQVLAHLLVEKRARRLRGPSLVVAPTSVVPNWVREAQRFTPSLRVLRLDGPARRDRFDEIPDHDLVVTSYALLRRDVELLEEDFTFVILDEAQAIKNPEANVTLAAKALRAQHRLALSGTPMENNLAELWSVVDFAVPGVLGPLDAFERLYRRPIERTGDRDRLASLRARIAPLVLRRTKGEVLTELPPKTEIVQYAELRAGQRDLYESVRVAMVKKVRDAIERQGLARSQIVFLDALLKLRQVCCHPAIVKLDQAKAVTRSAKLEVLLELLEQVRAEGRRALVFSQFTTMLDVIAEALRERGFEFLTLTGKTKRRQELVDAFQGGTGHVFLISLKAGGTGLNLTAADVVVHYDPWWNPAVERQATDRAHRFGQDSPVTVYRLVCADTVEERILELQARKQALADSLQADGEVRSGSFSADDLEFLLRPM